MKIVAIDNIEDFFAAETEARKQADSRVRPFQAALKPGDCFIRYLPDYDLVIWGEVIELTDEEDRESYAQPHLANYRMTRCSSTACAEGEFGSVHVSTVDRVITREQFEAARKEGWPSSVEKIRKILGISASTPLN